MSGFRISVTSAFCAGLWVTNCFAASSPQPATDLRAAAPASLPEGQPDGFIPPSLLPAVPELNTDLLKLAREANEEVYSSLQSFVCNEEMHRFKGRISGASSRPIDTVTAKVSFENGVEHYSEVRQNDRERATISGLAGAWSTGEFGTLLQQTQVLLKTQAVLFRMNADMDGTPAAVYAVEISEADSPWDLEIRAQHFRIPFRTEVWVSRISGEILKIERISTSIPFHMGISEIQWGVTLQKVELNGKGWLLPKTGDYAVMYEESGRREWNEMTFSNYHRYGSEVALRFQ